jgi:hypothetical protein
MEGENSRADICRNCGAPVSRNFCAECGQDTSLHPLSVWEFVHELVSHYVAVEGKLWRTLALLAFRPGRLTVEYLAGRRQRYIIPLRLYLTASFLFFAIAQWSGQLVQTVTVVSPRLTADGGGASVDLPMASLDLRGPSPSEMAGIARLRFEDCLQPQAHCPLLKRLAAPAMVALQKDPQHVIERFSERLRHSLSYAMFLLLPVFASLLALVYRNRHRYYGEHLVFSLHVHSFWFFLALLSLVLPEVLADWLPLAYAAYGLWALHRVYGGRWQFTFLRGATLAALYGTIMILGASALGLLLLAS